MIAVTALCFNGCRSAEDLFTHTIMSTNSSPEGTSVTAWDDGQPVKRASVYNKAYELSFITENPTETLDSVKAEKEGCLPFLIKKYSVTDKKILDINLTPLTLNKTIWLYGTASSPNGATITAWDDGKTIGSAVVANNAYKTPDYEIAMSDDEIDSARITSNGYRTLIIKNIPIPTGGQQLEFNLEQAAYQHSLTITLISSEAGEGHLVRDSPIILTNSEGTKTLNTSAQTVTYHWTSEHETETITYDINPTGTGHQDVAAKQTSVGASKSIDETLVANDFSGDITYTIKDQDSQNVSGANVSASQGKSGTTNTSGNVTLTAFTIAENNYSEPVSTAISHTVSKEGYLTKNGSANINAGANNVNETIEEIINSYNHNLTITLISSEANEGKLVRDSPIILTNSQGTRTLNTSGQTITYNWTSNQETENIIYDINVNGNGHVDVPAKSVSVGTALTENRTLTANDWTGDVPYHITDQTLANVAGATVAAGGKSATTNSSGDATLAELLITENYYSEPVATSITTTVSGAGVTTKQETHSINAGTNPTKEIQVQRTIGYDHRLTINLLSSEAGEGHVVRDSPVTFITSEGSTTLTTSGQTITYTWTDTQPTAGVTYDIQVSGSGHQDVGPKVVNVGTALTENRTLTANDWAGDITYTIKDQDSQNVSGALVTTTQSKSGTTNTSGNVTLLNYVIAENTYSEPLATTINHTVTKTGYTTKNGSANINTGTNNVNETIEEVMNNYNFSITFNLLSSEASEGHLVRDSPIVFTNSQGTRTLNTSGQTVTYNWTNTTPTETVTYDINPTGTGHQNPAAKQTSITGTKTVDETLVANDFSGDITYTIKDQDSQNVSGALVTTTQSKSGTTNTSGNVTLLNYIITENTYSEPLATTINHTVTKTGYTTKNGSANINTGTNNVNETIEEVMNNYQHNLTITLISSEAGEGHLVRDSPIVFTNSQGTRTLNTSGQTITYNWTSTQATENITYDIQVSGSGHQDVPAKAVSIGTALTENRTLTANDWAGDITYTIKDQDSQNVSGALVTTTQSKSGTTNTSGNVTLLNYIITENTYSEPLTTNISHTVTKTGYTTKNGSANINTGTNNVNETIEEIAANSFSESVVFADQTADEYDNGLVFIIKTLNDGQEHAYNVTDAQHVQDVTLTGNYDASTPIELYYTTTSASAQGKEAKILTVVRSRRQPTASNGSRTTTLTTTINDLFTPSIAGDTAWVLSLDTDMYNDAAFRAHVNGGKEWVHSSGGNRAMNINGITREVDLSAGTYGADITADELQALRQRMALFNQDFWTRGTGLVILNANLIESANYNTSAGSINIFYDRTEPQPGNTHYQVSTTRANTYDHGIGFVPRGTGMYLGQFTGETIQAVDWIFDDTSGGILGVYNHDQNGNPYLEREDELVVNMTYVGGKAPKNE